MSHSSAASWSQTDADLDEIIRLASQLKGGFGGVRSQIDGVLQEKESNVKKIHGDIDALQAKIDSNQVSSRAEREAIERQIADKEAQQAAKLHEMEARIHANIDAQERAEREREAARGDASAEKGRITSLLADLEEDASTYNRLRPAGNRLDSSDVEIIRKLFLSSAVAAGGKLSFADLKQIMVKYSNTLPEGSLRKLFELVEGDTKGRMSYVTMVAVANDLAQLVSDFRKIDANSSNTLSRKEFRDHFSKLGFEKKSVLDALFRYADEDESDEVTFHEYVHLVLCMLVLRILYTFADYDKSGQLSKDETKKVLADAAVNPAYLTKFDQFFAVVDVDNSGTLNYPEFVMLVLFMFCDGEGIPKPIPLAQQEHPVAGQYYYIASLMNGKVLDVVGGGGQGARIIMHRKKSGEEAGHYNDNNQKFKFTHDGYIEPAHRPGLVFDIFGGLGNGNPLTVGPNKGPNDKDNQQFRYDRTTKMIHCGPYVLDIAFEDKNDGAAVGAGGQKSAPAYLGNQQWELQPTEVQRYQ